MTSSRPSTHVLTQGGFRTLNGLRKRLVAAGIPADVLCPPGVDPNG